MLSSEKRGIEQAWWERTHGEAYDSPEPEIIDRLYVESLLAQVSRSMRQLIMRIYFDGYSSQEIAIRGLSRSRQYHGRLVSDSAVRKRHGKVLTVLREISERMEYK